jgi:hypothetical protein
VVDDDNRSAVGVGDGVGVHRLSLCLMPSSGGALVVTGRLLLSADDRRLLLDESTGGCNGVGSTIDM